MTNPRRNSASPLSVRSRSAHHEGMAATASLDDGIEVFGDPRGDGRALRVHWHPEDGLLVLSIWREDRCVATSRLCARDVPSLIRVLAGGLALPAPDDAQPTGQLHSVS
jgi:hypothetical protein